MFSTYKPLYFPAHEANIWATEKKFNKFDILMQQFAISLQINNINQSKKFNLC